MVGIKTDGVCGQRNHQCLKHAAGRGRGADGFAI